MVGYLALTIGSRVGVQLWVLGLLSDGIVGDTIAAEIGKDIRLERYDQGQIKGDCDLLLRRGYVICGAIPLRMEFRQQTGAQPLVLGCKDDTAIIDYHLLPYALQPGSHTGDNSMQSSQLSTTAGPP